MADSPTLPAPSQTRSVSLGDLLDLGAPEAAERLREISDQEAAELLSQVNPARAVEILGLLEPERQDRIAAATPFQTGRQWLRGHEYPEGSVGRLVEAPLAVFGPEETVEAVVEKLRILVRQALITYSFVTDRDGSLLGVVAFRDLLFAGPQQRLEEVMTRNPFYLRPEMPLVEAMRSVVTRHFPAYPVCDGAGRLLGMVRGHVLFEEQAYEISAQAGTMVGVDREERTTTPWLRSLKFRHPWLQLNLLTAFVAAAVVGYFEETVDRLVVLAVFLPVLAGQSGNTGCQALAVTLRGLTLGELRPGKGFPLLLKEAWLGALNGALVGLVAGSGMYLYALRQGSAQPLLLAAIVWLALTASCIVSGISGATIPQVLQRLGADPATASSIFLTTATDVASMGIFLGLATWILL